MRGAIAVESARRCRRGVLGAIAEACYGRYRRRVLGAFAVVLSAAAVECSALPL